MGILSEKIHNKNAIIQNSTKCHQKSESFYQIPTKTVVKPFTPKKSSKQNIQDPLYLRVSYHNTMLQRSYISVIVGA